MRIRFDLINLEIELGENEINVITIENVSDYRSIVGDLYRLSNNNDGRIVISSGKGEEAFSKVSETIINPFSVSLNSKKILNSVYKEIYDIGIDKHVKDFINLSDQVGVFIDKMINCVPYELQYLDNITIQDYLKVFDVKFDETDMGFLEHLIIYINTIRHVLNKSVVFIVGLKDYINEDEISYLYERCLYEKIKIVLIEHVYHKPCNCNEKCFIVDEDHCIIKVW